MPDQQEQNPPPPAESPAAGPPVIGYAERTLAESNSDSHRKFLRRLANFSWAAPLFIFFDFVMADYTNATNEPKVVIVAKGLIYMIVWVGLAAGILALLSARRHGKAGIFVPALIGVCVNGAIAILAVASVIMRILRII